MAIDNLSLNGVARYQQLNKPLFVVGLYTQSPITDEKPLFENRDAFRLLVAIEGERVSGRSFRRMLMEGVTINHTSAELARQNIRLAKLAASLAQHLNTGDRFEIVYHPVSGTDIIYNGQRKLHIDDRDFGPLLLRGWIGEVPLSSDFKMSLLQGGNVNQTLVAALASLQPTPATVIESTTTTVVKSDADQPAITQSQRVQPEIAEPVVAKPVLAVSAPQIEVPEVKAVASVKPPSAQVTKTSEVAASAPNAITKVIAEKRQASGNETLASVKPPVTDQAVKEEQPGASALESLAGNATASVKSDVEAEGTVDERMLALEQEYYEKLVAEVKRYQTIPFEAFQRRWSDDLRLQITIGKEGKVIDVQLLKMSRYDLFNQQAMDAVKRAEPFTKIPSELGEEEFTFSVPLDYRLLR